MATRRDILIQGGVVAAGYFSSRFAITEAQAQSKPLRKSVSDLQPNDPILKALRDGVAKLKAKPASDKLSWRNLANIHGTEAGFHKCPHGNWYFLPWHRAYLLMYERLIRDATGIAEFALPYWDWTRNSQLPASFVQPAPNPLFEPRDMSATDVLPAENVGQPIIDTIIGESPFETFGTSRPNGQNSLDQIWQKRLGIHGTLEFNPHNNVHGLVGGVMGSAMSARDPLFLMHHCNIDRIWAVWRAAGNEDSTDPLWRDMQFVDHFFNVDGSSFSPKVSDVLDTDPLGYTYGLPQAQMSLANVAALNHRLSALIAVPGQPVEKVRTFRVANTIAATSSQPLSVPVTVSAPLVSAAARRASTLGAGGELLNFSVVREQAAAKTRVFAFIREIDLSNAQGSQFRVFVNCDYLSQSTSIADRHYVGTFGFFGIGGAHAGHDGHEGKPSVAVDLTTALEKLYGSSAEAPDTIRVQVLPVPRGKTSLANTGRAKPTTVEIAVVSP